jgi:hypothetical protein
VNLNEEVVIVDRIRAKVTLNKPIYIGLTVFDVSKSLMFDFHYNIIAKRYGKNARLLFTATDALLQLDHGRRVQRYAGIPSSARH